MTRATRASAATPLPTAQTQRKRKRPASPQPVESPKFQKIDDADDIHHDVHLTARDADSILDVLELSDTQGLLDRVFPSENAPDTLVSLRSLLKHPSDIPLQSVKAAITHLRPISSLPRSQPSQAASQQLAFANLALALIQQASCNAITPNLERDSLLEPESEDVHTPAATDIRRKYALVQHLPQGDYWTSLSSDAAPNAIKALSTGHAELVAILPSSSSTTVESTPTLASLASRPLTAPKKAPAQRRVTTAAFLDYGPHASFAPTFDHGGELIGRRQLGEVIYQKEQKRRDTAVRQRIQDEKSRSATPLNGGDVVMEEVSDAPDPTLDIDEQIAALLPPGDVDAIKQALGNLEMENAVQELLARNERALVRLGELQYKRYSEGGAKCKPAEEGSEEWETATCIMESLTTLLSLRPRSSDPNVPSLVPPASVLHRLHRSLALEPTAGWYGNLPPARATALKDDSTIKIKSPTITPAAPTPAPVAVASTATPQPTRSAYPSYAYNYGSQQQQVYQHATAYSTFKPGQTTGYYPYAAAQATTQQAYYAQTYAGGSNQQPYGAATGQQPYAAYQGWYSQYQPNQAATTKATPTPIATTSSYASHYTPNPAVNGAGVRTPAVANTVSKVGTPVAANPWPGSNNQTQGVAPTLPSHLKPNQQTTPSAAYPPQVASYYQTYQTATPPAR